jgi:hypothetical protein
MELGKQLKASHSHFLTTWQFKTSIKGMQDAGRPGDVYLQLESTKLVVSEPILPFLDVYDADKIFRMTRQSSKFQQRQIKPYLSATYNAHISIVL